MSNTNNTASAVRVRGIICEEDKQQKEFQKFVDLWLNNEISYQRLLDNFPDYSDSMIRKLLNFFRKKLAA